MLSWRAATSVDRRVASPKTKSEARRRPETGGALGRYIKVKAPIALAILLFQGAASFAQHNHGQGHPDYSLWASRKTENCCNNQDCGELRPDEWRETNEGTDVKILGQWCPVLPEHLIIRGKSPDWSKPHACINKSPSVATAPCLRLLCFSGIPKS